MITSDITVNIDTAKLNEFHEETKRALIASVGELQNRIREEQVIPRDTGALQGEKFFIDDTMSDKGIVQLVNEGPYARRLYFHPEYNFRTDKNKNAQGMWFTLWQKGGYFESEPQEIYEKILEKMLGGEI